MSLAIAFVGVVGSPVIVAAAVERWVPLQPRCPRAGTYPVRLLVAALATASLWAGGLAQAEARAPRGSSVPVAGDWEGTGSDGIPLSFELVRRSGRVVATSIALGSPNSCPADARDSDAIPLQKVGYAGPGGVDSTGFFGSSPTATLSGKLSDDPSFIALIQGRFTTPRTGTFEARTKPPNGCGGWPKSIIKWKVHRAARRVVPDASWAAELSGPGISSGTIGVVVAGKGRVVSSFTGSLTCNDTDRQGIEQQGNESFGSTPAYLFIHPDGNFHSPLKADAINGLPTTWDGTFSPSGALTGTLSVWDPCTNGPVNTTFTASQPTP